MKKTFFLAIAALFLFSASAQDSTSKAIPTTPATTTTPATPVVIPDHLVGVTSNNIKPEHYLPVLGSYQSAGSTTATVNVVLDEQNIGIVWIDGLPQGRIKALLKKSPAIYKIPAQKTAEGKSVGEGTLIFDQASKQLWVCTSCSYNETDPASTFTSTKTKAKVGQYTKVTAATDATLQAPSNQQQ